jgi:NAD(P)-dependent dehydrogenase (short-subunit alcohol dehydrogenase family)
MDMTKDICQHRQQRQQRPPDDHPGGAWMTEVAYPELAERVVLITGGGDGIGKASALAFAGYGSRVVVVGRRAVPLEATVAEIEAAGGKAYSIVGDVTVERDVASMVEVALGECGRIDVLVNNAGAHQPGALIVDMPLDVWNRTLAVNLTGTMLCTKHVGRHMISVGNGVIVNLGSLAGQLPRFRNGAYGAAKAAIAHFTKTAALEFSGWGIRVNAVSPGSTFTALLQQAIERDGQPDAAYRVAGNLSQFRQPVPLQRIATPEEQAAVIVFLASDSSVHMTGQIITVDGGEGIL